MPRTSLAQGDFDSLVVGEWSEPGKCQSDRFVFTSNGYFRVISRKADRWTTSFNSTYTRIPGKKSLEIISEYDGQRFYDSININRLSRAELLGEWLISIGGDELHNIFWVRCSTSKN